MVATPQVGLAAVSITEAVKIRSESLLRLIGGSIWSGAPQPISESFYERSGRSCGIEAACDADNLKPQALSPNPEGQSLKPTFPCAKAKKTQQGVDGC
jgi:hypothetical protein